MKKSLKGFTLVEMLIVIVAVGIIGSITTRLLFQGSEIFISETKRQSFVNEVRATVWRVLRESHGQTSNDQLFSSSNKLIYLKHANEDEKQIKVNQSNDIILSQDGLDFTLTNYNSAASQGITYYDNNYNIIVPSQNGLTENQAKTVHMIELNFNFNYNFDTTSLSSYVYPHNFSYGKKMGYHD